MKNNKSCPRKTSVGGQALIEGVMMNGPKGCALSVRNSSGDIITEQMEFKHIKDKIKILGAPFIRGIVNYIETMKFGYKSLMRSAELSGQLEAEEDTENMSKLDKWLNDHMGPKMLGVITGIATVIAMALGVFLFAYLPTLIVDLMDEHLFSSKLVDFHALFEGIMRAAIIVLYMFIVSKQKDIHRVFMYHGAEHKSITCYEKGLELNVENVRSCKRFHPRCGTSFIFIIVIISIIVSSIVLILFPALGDKSLRLVWIVVKILVILPVVTGISYEMIKYAGRHDNILTKIFSAPGMWMQRITTVEPTDDMIEVGIASIKAVITDNPEDDSL
ncbi:MAG: DUF1385 domain-containing protein [Oscillospiraceae bacterium]|nr:DUF1385 domain-containing protein [Oscillospiraceae bacterium]